jgi:hypothetical protein
MSTGKGLWCACQQFAEAKEGDEAVLFFMRFRSSIGNEQKKVVDKGSRNARE